MGNFTQMISRNREYKAHLIDSDFDRNDCANLVLRGCVVLFAESHDVDTLHCVAPVSHLPEQQHR